MGREVITGGYRQKSVAFGFVPPVCTADINFDKAVLHLDYNQERIEDILGRYGSKLRMDMDQDIGRFVLESVADDLTVKQVIEEFELQPVDEYLSESIRITEAKRNSN